MAGTMAISALMQVVFEKTTSLIQRTVMGQYKETWGVNVHKEMMKLQSTLSTIRSVLEDAEEQQLRNNTLRDWLAKLKDAARDADDILDLFHWEFLRQEAESHPRMISKVSHFFSKENPILFRFRLVHRIKEVVEELDGIAAERSKFHISTCSDFRRGNNNRTETHSFVIESEVAGRREDKDNIVEMLISSLDSRDCVSVLPIVGMGGLGKTTLAKIAYNDQRVREHFELLMWICVSDKFDVAMLAEEVIKSATGNPSPGLSMDLLQIKLGETLGSKRYLLVLDDVWNEDATKWQELRILLSRGVQGSVVMVTTRSNIVSSIMRTMDAYMLAHLSDEDCWDVFKQKAFGGDSEVPTNLVKIGKEIVKKLGGLPLAAETVGGFMRFKMDEREWSSVLASEIWNLSAGENDILPALRLSYDHLPSHLKECFAYCAIFPKDYVINKEILIQLWMANGFIPCGGEMEIEDKGHEIFNELIARSLLQNVEVEQDPFSRNNFYHYMTSTHCKMHDLIHDLAQAITKNECCILGDKEMEESQSAALHHISHDRNATTKSVNEAICNSSNSLRTLFNIHASCGPSSVWLKAKSLRVFGSPWFLLKEALPYIDNLKHLRYLDLSYSNMETLPEATSRLFHLQTLKLKNCWNLCELPKGMKNLKKLRHLYIDECDKLTYMPIGMGSLTCLRTLSMYVVGSTARSGNIRELKDMNIGGELALQCLNNVKNATDAKEASLCSKHNLLSLDLSWNKDPSHPTMENAEEVIECLQPHQKVKWLRVKEYRGIHFPNWMMQCEVYLPNLVEIVLYNCSGCEHLPSLGQLPFLEVLKIEKMAGVKYLGGNQSDFYGRKGGNAVDIFPSLKVFRLSGMANLEEWVGMEVTRVSTFFQRLILLGIIDCPKMKTMPHLPSIKVLSINHCPLLLPEKGFFLKLNFLNELYISGCNKLALMLTKEELRGSSTLLGHLEILTITECDELISLSDEFMCRLSSLKILTIKECPNLVGLLALHSSTEGRSLQLQHLTSLERLTIRWCDKLVGNPLELPRSRLRELTFFCCPNLRSLSEELGLLTSLKSLSIRSCENLALLPDGLGRLTTLEELEIFDCPGMTKIPDWLGCLTSLRKLDVGSQTLLSLPQSLGCLTALQNLVIRYVTWTSLPEWLGVLTRLAELKVVSCSNLTSLPDGLGNLTQLKVLHIDDCPRLASLPKGLQQQLPRLERLVISVSGPKLARQCAPRGKYWHLVSRIPNRFINFQINSIENSWKFWKSWTEPPQSRSLSLLLQ